MARLKAPLKTLTIKGFKSIRELNEFRFSKGLNVFIGGNGTGKSNLVDFFRMLSAMMKTDGLKEYIAGDADLFLFGGAKHTSSIVIRMHFGRNWYNFDLAPTSEGFFLINNENCDYERNQFDVRSLGSGNYNPVLLKDRERKGMYTDHNVSWYVYQSISNWRVYHFHDTSHEAGMMRFQDQGHDEVLDHDASNIAPFLLGLRDRDPKAYKKLIDAVQLALPFLDDFILKPNNKERVRLRWRQKGLNHFPLRPTQLSDGSIRFICLVTALLQPDPPSTIIIDEPELGLHPHAIAILAELMQSAAKRTQLVVATQSAALIDHFDVEDIVVVNRKDGASTFERLKEEDYNVWLEEYTVGELWSKNVISGGPVNE